MKRLCGGTYGAMTREGAGTERGLRGVSFYEGYVLIAASDELMVYDRNFKDREFLYRNAYLKHCHEVYRAGDVLVVDVERFRLRAGPGRACREVHDWLPCNSSLSRQVGWEAWATAKILSAKLRSGRCGWPSTTGSHPCEQMRGCTKVPCYCRDRTLARPRGARWTHQSVRSRSQGTHNAQPFRGNHRESHPTESDCVFRSEGPDNAFLPNHCLR